ncbi:MAG: DUF2914 domain-containing protein [Spirochaetes bacterium]|nr:DUF2914 domain-containing protein [Spirochaetota bacterium]
MQATDDPAGFWKGSCREVRKKPGCRYPRNPWPENPKESKMVKSIFAFFTEGFPPRNDFPAGFRGLIACARTLIETWPRGLQRLLALQPIFSLSTGLVALVLIKQGFENIPLSIVFIIVAFSYIMFRLYLHRGGKGLLTSLWDAALIFVLNNLLLFVLPFYMEATTFPSRNMVFVPLIITMIVIASWFTLYLRLIARHPLRSSIFYAFTFFCVLNLLFPVLFGMGNIHSLLASGAIAVGAMGLFIYPHIDIARNVKNGLIFFSGAVLFLLILWFGRSLIPPAPLKMTRSAACLGIEEYRPLAPFRTARASETPEVVFYSSIFAPRGLSERIRHVWFHNGRRLFSVPLSEIHGGRKEGFGTWSRHTILEGPGRYVVEVWTEGSQLLGAGEFRLY